MRVTGMPAASGSPLNRLSRVSRMFPDIIYRQLESGLSSMTLMVGVRGKDGKCERCLRGGRMAEKRSSVVLASACVGQYGRGRGFAGWTRGGI